MTEENYIRRCFELAQRAIGNTYPNPMVGAVIVHKDKIIGEGYHEYYGGAHAEVNAIRSVENEELLKESTLYVNLEPCSHYGKTPPCADLIISKQIKRVVISNKDPFPEVSGRGIKKMQDAGIEVICGVLEKEGNWVNRRFFTFHSEKRAYTLLKWAQTADGYIDFERTSAENPPLKISSIDTLPLVYQLRSREAGIVVGTRTALLDNPSLTIRDIEGRQPIRILIDRELKVPSHYHLYDQSVPTLIFTEKEKNTEMENIRFEGTEFDKDGKIVIDKFLRKLYELKIQSVVVEGGAQLLQSFLDNELWDEIRIETNESLHIDKGVKAPRINIKEIKKELIGTQKICEYYNSRKNPWLKFV